MSALENGLERKEMLHIMVLKGGFLFVTVGNIYHKLSL